jgi:hypothetical protein
MHYKAPIREGDIAHHPGVLLGSDIGAGYSDLFSRALLLPHKYIRSLSCLPACIPYIIVVGLPNTFIYLSTITVSPIYGQILVMVVMT